MLSAVTAIEVNTHSGRNDWQAVGRKGSAFEGKACVIEFKHFTRKEGERLGILSLLLSTNQR
jgi:hypothetical protein